MLLPPAAKWEASIREKNRSVLKRLRTAGDEHVCVSFYVFNENYYEEKYVQHLSTLAARHSLSSLFFQQEVLVLCQSEY